MIKNQDLKRRILEISYKYKLSHVGSCLTAVDIIDEIYAKKKLNEKFVLSSGHAGLALYVVLEKYSGGGLDAEYLFEKSGVHPDRLADVFKPNPLNRFMASPFFVSPIDCSTGSLGQGLPIAVGMALADRSRNVYCLASDGELQEGSCHEAAEIMWNEKVTNLKVYVNCNGWGAYKGIDMGHLMRRFAAYYDQNIYFKDTSKNVDPFPFLKGQDAHYHVMSEDDYKAAMEILK